MIPKLRNSITGNARLKINAASGNEVTLVIDKGVVGPEGPPGQGVPSGGTTGQVLVKASNANYDTQWYSLSGMNYQGTWDTATNTPTLVSSVGISGGYYIVTVAGNTDLNGITDWKVNDWAIFNGSVWEKIDNTDSVTSVNGQTGAVNLVASDVGAPSTTGAGASGTWNIGISGNAATATSAITAQTANNASSADYAATAGIANTATSAVTSTNISGGAAGSLSYQSAPNITSMLPIAAASRILTSSGTAPQWSDPNAITVGLSNNIAGGTARQLLVQSASGVTQFINAPTVASTFLQWTGTTFDWVGAGGVGTVTSVGVSGGATGLTTTGGPITTSGTITLGGTLNVAYGGTGVNSISGLLFGNGTSPMTAATGLQIATALGSSAVTQAINADKATNIVGGVANQIPYQASPDVTGFIAAPSVANTVLNWNGTTFNWVTQTAGIIGTTQSATPFKTAIGFESMLNVTGINNTALGYQAGKAFTSGTNNVAIGTGALLTTATTSNNIAIGNRAMGGTASAGTNIAIGTDAGLNAGGADNIFMGYTAGNQVTNIAAAIAIGTNTLGTSTSAANGTIAIGYNCLAVLGVGAGNVAIGANAGQSMTSSSRNTLLGNSAGAALITNGDCTLIGSGAGALLTQGNNTFVGSGAGDGATTVSDATALGKDAIGGGATTTAAGAVGVGASAGLNLTSGSGFVGVGYQAGSAVTTGSGFTGIGYQAGAASTSGTGGTFVGYQAGQSVVTGAGNVMMGYQAGKLGTGNFNTVLGHIAADGMTAADGNTVVGYNSGGNISTGSQNTFVGNGAGLTITSGGNNTIVGGYTGATATTNSHIVLSDGAGKARLYINEFGAYGFTTAGTTPATANYGNSGDVLNSGGSTGAPYWQSPNKLGILSTTTSITIPKTNEFTLIDCSINGNLTITLPTLTAGGGDNGYVLSLKRIDGTANVATIIGGAAGQTIDGQTNKTIGAWNAIELVSFGTVWYVVNSYVSSVPTLQTPAIVGAMAGDGTATVIFEPVDGATGYTAEVTKL